MNADWDKDSPLLVCHGLTKRYGALVAVNDVSFHASAGEILGIGGPNGAGKTTLFDVITGLIPLDSGIIRFQDREIQQLSPWKISHCGLARTFQLNAGFESMTARENVLIASYFGSQNRLVPRLGFDRKSKKEAQDALEAVGLAGKSAETVKDMRVLDRKLLMLACALSKHPKLILLDEPVGGLTPNEIDTMIDILNVVKNSGTSIIVIEHVMRLLVELSDRVLILHHGKKIFEGPAREFSKDKTIIEVYLGEETAKRIQEQLNSKAAQNDVTA